jgi:hypothetical protein
MTSLTQIMPSAVEVDWHSEQSVRAKPRSRARFRAQRENAARILQLARQQVESQLHLLMDLLGSWMRNHESRVQTAFLTMRDSQFLFLAVPRTAEYDPVLEDAVSDLDFMIANDQTLHLIRMNALVLPPASEDSWRSFFDERFLLIYNGK